MGAPTTLCGGFFTPAHPAWISICPDSCNKLQTYLPIANFFARIHSTPPLPAARSEK